MDNIEEIEEVWKDIPGYEGYYQVSDMGRVRSLDRIILKNNNHTITCKGVILKNYMNKHKYYVISLVKNTKKLFKVHQLVAMCFLGHVPCGQKMVVDHINNDKLDNRLINLQVITNRQNISKDQKMRSSTYVGVNWCKRSKKWVAHIKINRVAKHLGQFYSEEEASNAYQVALKAHIENGGQ